MCSLKKKYLLFTHYTLFAVCFGSVKKLLTKRKKSKLPFKNDGRFHLTSFDVSTADRPSSTVRHALTTRHEFHLVVNPAGDEDIGCSDAVLRCRNTVRCRAVRMTPVTAARGKASTSKPLMSNSLSQLTSPHW